MNGQDAQAAEIATSNPHPARMYDWFLGGKDKDWRPEPAEATDVPGDEPIPGYAGAARKA